MNKALNLRDFTKDNLYPIYTKEKYLHIKQLVQKIYQLLELYKNEVKHLEFKHKPVLLKECIEGLNIKKDGIYALSTKAEDWIKNY